MRKQLSFTPRGGLPIGADKFLECLECGETVPLSGERNTHCKCQNIGVDADYGRVAIRDWDRVNLFGEV